MKSNSSITGTRKRRQAGMSLAELLVAMTVFVVAAAVAMILYNALARSYKLGDNATAAQQNTRIAFENLVTDLRMMGFNYNPDGTVRPDEQLEGAWDTAITLRGDFDFEDASRNADVEVALASGSSPYDIVSVGNDEIVTYALGKPGATSGDTLSFVADVTGGVRDATTETVNIPNLAVVQDDPPYTLYRITVNTNSTNVTRTPVADNIYSMEFLYYDAGGALLSPDTPADVSDDIGGADTSVAVGDRELVRRVEVRLTGMTPDPDMRYTDPDDPFTATRNHRKFTLVQDVVPRNAGYVGRPDVDRIPPSQPQNLQACPGHCEAALLTWDTPAASDAVSQWTVLQGTSATALGAPETAKTTPWLVDGLTEGGSYFFRVRAEDAAGNVSPGSALATPAPVTIGDINTPSAVFNLKVSGGSGGVADPAEDDAIRLLWTEVTTNVETVSCDPEPTKIRDLAGYRLYRSTVSGSVADPANLLLDETALPAGIESFKDTNVVACRTYYYDITAVDECGNESQPLASPKDGTSTTQSLPEQPGGLQAAPAGADTVELQWSRVTTNNAGATIQVDTYRIYRLALTAALSPTSAASASWDSATQVDVTVSDPSQPSWIDTNAITLPAGMSYYYRVSALTDCASPYDEGPLSTPVEAVGCDLGATILLTPANGDSVSGTVDGMLYVSGADTYTGYVTITDPYGAVVFNLGSAGNPNSLPVTFAWNTATLPPGEYRVVATVTDSNGCSETVANAVMVSAPVACCLQPLSPVLGPTAGRLSSRYSDVIFSLVNNCAQDLLIGKQVISWTNVTGNDTRLDAICWDVDPLTPPEDCTPVLTYSVPARSPAQPVFDPELSFGAYRDDLFPLIVGYKFTNALVTGTNIDDLGETITVDMFYRTAGSTSDAQCRFQIQTNPLDVYTVEP